MRLGQDLKVEEMSAMPTSPEHRPATPSGVRGGDSSSSSSSSTESDAPLQWETAELDDDIHFSQAEGDDGAAISF